MKNGWLMLKFFDGGGGGWSSSGGLYDVGGMVVLKLFMNGFEELWVGIKMESRSCSGEVGVSFEGVSV